jgi:UMF1 family MFS transporter
VNAPWLKRALPWALYDWANSAFATTVMAAFVPVFNNSYWNDGADGTVAIDRLGTTSSTAAIIIAIIAPIIGAIADRGGSKKRFLAAFAGLGILATGSLAFAGEGEWAMALTLYVFAWIGFAGANVFYDSLIVAVADRDKLDMASALGFSLGYAGGGLLLLVNVLMATYPSVFGLDSAATAVRLSFAMVAIWWAVFSLPLLFRVPEPRLTAPLGVVASVRSGLRQFVDTFHEIRKLRTIALFLLGYWFYIDGVDTIIQMAVALGAALGFPETSLPAALLITQFVGFPAALAFGKLGERIGAKRGILIAVAVYIGICVWGSRMTSVREFYMLAVVVGLVQGGIQSLSRSLFARLIPAEKAGEFFGFYNMLGKFAAVLGPLLMAKATLLSGSPRVGILAIIPLFVVGGLLLASVRLPKAA